MYIKVKVKTEEKFNSIEKLKDDEFLIKTKSKAEEGMANESVIKIICEYFKIPQNKVRIIKGYTSPSKIIEIML